MSTAFLVFMELPRVFVNESHLIDGLSIQLQPKQFDKNLMKFDVYFTRKNSNQIKYKVLFAKLIIVINFNNLLKQK